MSGTHGRSLAAIAVAVSSGPGTGSAVAIGRGAAQRLARAELAKPIYHPHVSLLQRITDAALAFLDRLVLAASSAVPGGWWGLVALAALAVIVTAGLLAWIGPVARTHRAGRPLTAAGQGRSARDHRQDAQRLAQEGDYAAAIIERVRAIAAELEERGVLPPRAGRTADEFAGEAGQALPACAGALRDAAARFDEVCYGKHPGTRPVCERLARLDEQIMARAPHAGRPGTLAVSMAGRAP